MENASDTALLVTSSYDMTIRLWSIAKGKTIATIQHNEGQVNTLALTANGRDLALGTFQKVRIYDVAASKDPKATIDLPKNVTVVGFESHGRWMFTGGDDGYCRIWEMRSNQLVASRMLGFKNQITSMVTNLNQNEIFIATNPPMVFVWDMMNHHYSRMPLPEKMLTCEWVERLALDPSGKRLTGITNCNRLLCWDLMTRQLENRPFDVTQSPIIPVEQDTMTYGVLKNEDALHHFNGHGLSVRYSPDGRYIVTCGSEKEIRLLDGETLDVLKVMKTNSHWNWDAVFSDDGKYFFTGGNDNNVKLWDTENARVVAQWEGHMKPITAMCINHTH